VESEADLQRRILAQSIEDGDDARRHGGGSARGLRCLFAPTGCPALPTCSRDSNPFRSHNL